MTIIYNSNPDWWIFDPNDPKEDRPCVIVAGKGDIPPGAFQVENHPDEEWTAWYWPGEQPKE
jgi:hypothetical protein